MSKDKEFTPGISDIDDIVMWIEHLKMVKEHPHREESEEFYQKHIDRWENKLQEIRAKNKKKEQKEENAKV